MEHLKHKSAKIILYVQDAYFKNTREGPNENYFCGLRFLILNSLLYSLNMNEIKVEQQVKLQKKYYISNIQIGQHLR